MTMTPEIRAAAERYRREAYKPGHFGDPEFRNVGYLTGKDGYEDRVLLSNWAATQIHADDDEAITSAWLREMGGERPMSTAAEECFVFGRFKKLTDSFGFFAVSFRRQPKQTAWTVAVGGYELFANGITTRRSLRRLLAALGAEAK